MPETRTPIARPVERQPLKDEMPQDFGHQTRRCSDCGDWLCRWNPGPDCYRHQSHHVMVDSAAELAELMSSVP